MREIIDAPNFQFGTLPAYEKTRKGGNTWHGLC